MLEHRQRMTAYVGQTADWRTYTLGMTREQCDAADDADARQKQVTHDTALAAELAEHSAMLDVMEEA